MKKILFSIVALVAIFVSCEDGKFSRNKRIVSTNVDDSVTIALAKLAAHDMLKIKELNLNVELFNQTFKDFYSGDEQVTNSVLQDAYTNVQNFILNVAPKRLIVKQNVFIEKLKADDSILKTDNGLFYSISDAGRKVDLPKITDSIKVKYRGETIDGVEFFNNFTSKPISISLDKSIKGWQEGIPLIGEGGQMTLYVPSELAYETTGEFANQMLIFEINLVEIINDNVKSKKSKSKNSFRKK